MHQVIIVGAGPAGAYLAYLLAKRGVDVLLLEKAAVPRYKPCGGALSPKALSELDVDVSSQIENTGYSVTVTHKMKRAIEIVEEKPITHFVDRSRFDAFLVERAAEAGAKFCDSIHIRDYEVGNSEVIVCSEHDKWRGQYLIGADGASSVVARRLGIRPHSRSVALEVELPMNQLATVIRSGQLLIDYGIAPAGYAWVFPKKGNLSIGVGNTSKRVSGRKLNALLDQWMTHIGVESSTWRSGVTAWSIPINSNIPVLHGEREIVVGDAAGLADAFTGEGIYAALASARAGAETLSQALAEGSKALAGYTEIVRKRLGEQVTSAYKLSRLMYPLSGVVHSVITGQTEWRHFLTRLISGDLPYPEALALAVEQLPVKLRRRVSSSQP